MRRNKIIGTFILFLLAFSVGVNGVRACDAVIDNTFIYSYEDLEDQILKFGNYYCVFYVKDVDGSGSLGYIVMDGLTHSATGVQWESPAYYKFHVWAASVNDTVVMGGIRNDPYGIELHIGKWNGTGIEWNYTVDTGIEPDDCFALSVGPSGIIYLSYIYNYDYVIDASYIGETWSSIAGFPKTYTPNNPGDQPARVLPYGDTPLDAYVVYSDSVDWVGKIYVADAFGTPELVLSEDMEYFFHAVWTGETVAIATVPYYDVDGIYGTYFIKKTSEGWDTTFIPFPDADDYLSCVYVGKSGTNVMGYLNGEVYLANYTDGAWSSSTIYEYGDLWFAGYADGENICFISYDSVTDVACIVANAVAEEPEPSGPYIIEVPPFVIISTNPFVPDHFCGIGGCYGIGELYFEVVGGGNVTVWAPEGFPGALYSMTAWGTNPFLYWAYASQNPPIIDYDNNTIDFYNIPTGNVTFNIRFTGTGGGSWGGGNNNGGGSYDDEDNNAQGGIPDIGNAVNDFLSVLPEPLRAPVAFTLVGLPIILILLLITGGGATVKGAYNKGRRP